jgi:hypothetical protein
MERVRDLLTERVKGQEPESLELHEDANRKVYVKDVGVHPVLSYDRVMELLAVGNANRQTAETKMNETSSRSHSIVQFTIVQTFDSLERRDVESVVYLVDLAGSERQGKTETTGLQFEEAKKINQSLLMLGRALNSFSERRGDTFVSLRESKLTRLLSECFGGNSKTWMLATVSPSAFNLTETMSTLEYATNAKSITNRAEVNRLQKQLETAELRKLVCLLENKFDEETQKKDSLEIECSLIEKRLHELQVELLRCVKSDESLVDIAKLSAENDRLEEELRAMLHPTAHGVLSSWIPSFTGQCSASLAKILKEPYDLLTLVLPSPTESGPGQEPALLTVEINRVGYTIADVKAQPLEWIGKERESVSIKVRIAQIQNMPRYSTGGAQVTLWFEGRKSTAVTTPIANDNDGNPIFNFQQKFLFGPETDALRNYFEGEVLHFSVVGFL